VKTVLAVVGALGILAILVIGGGGYYAYTRASAKVVEVSQREIEKFISTKHPPERVADSLHRLVNAAKLHQGWSTTFLVGLGLSSIQDGVMTDDKLKMLNEAADLAEQGSLNKEKIAQFMQKYEKIIPRRRYEPKAG